jgi:hypothetical protein
VAVIESPEPELLSETQRSEVASLRRVGRALAGALVALAAAATVGMILLVDEPRTDDMRKLAITAALAGLAGGSMRGLIGLVDVASRGFILSDGTCVLRGQEAADYARDLRAWEQRHSAHDDGNRGPPDRQDSKPEPRLFDGLSSSSVPELVVCPLVGAVFGVVVFAGVVGGFLVASTETGTYSAAALMFIAFLGGFFSNKFFERLSAASDALFGTQHSTRPAGSATSAPPDSEQSR